jgi:rod shape determining protein RodA
VWSLRFITRIDFRVVFIVAIIQFFGLSTIAAFSQNFLFNEHSETFFLPAVRAQIQWLILGWGCFLCTACFDYTKIREYAPALYVVSLLALIGLFFTDPIARVQRWYKIPLLSICIQPSEYAKIAFVFALSWFLERRASVAKSFGTFSGAMILTMIPFFLILKQPDLGTATVLYPIAIVLLYFGGIHKRVLQLFCFPGLIIVLLVSITFSGIVSHETLSPYLSKVLKEYQLQRLDPNTHHQIASQTAISLGGLTGRGWRQGDFWRGGSLPAPYTDSIFAAFGEEFGFVGLAFLLTLYYALIACTFQASAAAKEPFGRLLTAGIAVYIGIHVLVNVGMMSGCFPITGVPLVFMSYGGSSMAASMAALGVTQSVYSRRFMF